MSVNKTEPKKNIALTNHNKRMLSNEPIIMPSISMQEAQKAWTADKSADNNQLPIEVMQDRSFRDWIDNRSEKHRFVLPILNIVLWQFEVLTKGNRLQRISATRNFVQLFTHSFISVP